jgi:glycosyltransferase involved in cell wall biosynthesis
MRRIRVIHVSNGLHLGGMERLLAEFARHADQRRYALHFVSLTDRGAAADQIEALGFTVSTVGAQPGIRFEIAVKLRSLFRALGADIVHTHNTKPLLYGAPAAFMAGANVIHTRHGQRLGSTRRQTMLFNLAAKFANRVVSVSKDSTDLAFREGLPRQKLETIHNGVDVSAYTYRNPDLSAPLLFLGRLSREKDVGTLLRALRILKDRGVEAPLRIAGDGPERERLELLALELELSDLVSFLGVQSDVRALLHRSSALVLPSLSEGISLSLLEAMSCGVPVIATLVGGNVEVIEDGRSGMLIAPQAPTALADAIHEIRSNPTRSLHLAREARQRVEEEFDVSEMIHRYQSIYESVLSSSTAKRAA